MKQSFAATRRLTGLDLAELFKWEKSTSIKATEVGQIKGSCGQVCFCSDSAQSRHLTAKKPKQRPSNISPKYLCRLQQFCISNSDAKVFTMYLVSFNAFLFH